MNLDLIGVTQPNPTSVGSLAVRLMKPRDGAAFAIKEVQKGAAGTGPGAEITAFGAAGDALQTGDGILQPIVPIASTVASALESVTSKLDVIVKLGDQIATVRLHTHGFRLCSLVVKIHPYANIAWSVLTAVYKVGRPLELLNLY